MPGINKSFLRSASISLIALFFIFEGITSITDSQKKTQFEVKVYNLETYLLNKGFLLFSFEKFLQNFSSYIMILYGLLLFLLAVGFVFFEDKKKRTKIIQYLILLQVYDAFVMHNPFVENYEMRSLELKHFIMDIMIAFALIMVAGFRGD